MTKLRNAEFNILIICRLHQLMLMMIIKLLESIGWKYEKTWSMISPLKRFLFFISVSGNCTNDIFIRIMKFCVMSHFRKILPLAVHFLLQLAKGNTQFVQNTIFGLWEKMMAQCQKIFRKIPMNARCSPRNLRRQKAIAFVFAFDLVNSSGKFLPSMFCPYI